MISRMNAEAEQAKVPFAQWGFGTLAGASWVGVLAILGLQLEGPGLNTALRLLVAAGTVQGAVVFLLNMPNFIAPMLLRVASAISVVPTLVGYGILIWSRDPVSGLIYGVLAFVFGAIIIQTNPSPSSNRNAKQVQACSDTETKAEI